MTFIFDIEPVAKQRPRFSRSKVAYTPSKTRNFESTIRAMGKGMMAKPLEGALCVTLIFTFKKPKSVKRELMTVKPDLDNLIKFCDALNGVFWVDDNQIIEIHARKEYGEKSQIKVTIEQF